MRRCCHVSVGWPFQAVVCGRPGGRSTEQTQRIASIQKTPCTSATVLLLAHVTADLVLCCSRIWNFGDHAADALGLHGWMWEIVYDLPESVFLGCMLGQIGLVCVWVVLSAPRPVTRVGVFAWATLGFSLLFALAENAGRRIDFARLLDASAQVSGWSLFTLVVVHTWLYRWRRRGYRIGWLESDAAAVALETRFSLAQIMGVLLLVCIMLGAVQAGESGTEAAWLVAVGVFGGALTVLGVWVAWSAVSSWLRLGLPACAALLLGLLIEGGAANLRVSAQACVASLCVMFTVGWTGMGLKRTGYAMVLASQSDT